MESLVCIYHFFSFWKSKSEAEKVFRELIMHAIGKPPACRREGASGVLITGCLVFFWVVGTVSSLSADGNALLEFKRSVMSDPLRVFLNWNESDEDPCSWTGVICNLSSRRVVTLNIKGNPISDPQACFRRSMVWIMLC